MGEQVSTIITEPQSLAASFLFDTGAIIVAICPANYMEGVDVLTGLTPRKIEM